jgi:hypothetical protein
MLRMGIVMFLLGEVCGSQSGTAEYFVTSSITRYGYQVSNGACGYLYNGGPGELGGEEGRGESEVRI